MQTLLKEVCVCVCVYSYPYMPKHASAPKESISHLTCRRDDSDKDHWQRIQVVTSR